MRTYLLVFIAALCASGSLAAECHGKPSPDAQPNENSIQKPDFKLVGSTKNGKLYTVGTGNEVLKVLHVWGTPYEMGLAHGTLLKKEAADFMNQVWSYLEEQVIEAINGSVNLKFRDWFLRDVANLGLEAACDLEVAVTKKYSGGYFLEEIKGLAESCGVDYKKILRIHMLGELTKGSCSMFGAWGNALKAGQGVLQLRALDWNMDGPFKNFPQLTVYHPNANQTDDNGKPAHSFVNVGWTGWIGSITGMSSSKLAISEIGVSFPDASFGKESRFGVPFTYILRDVLQFDYTLDDAINRMANAHRTCDLIFGVGDGKENRGFRGVQYSASVANFFDDQNMMPVAEWHPKIENVVYFGMDWLCPGYSEVLSRQLMKYHGQLTAETAITNIVSIEQSGSTHIAIYDLTNDLMYVSFNKADVQNGPNAAYDRPFMVFNTAALFSESRP
ncbi:protein dcd1A [Ciona intestinalis]